MEQISGFGMKECLSLPSLGWKYFNSKQSRDEADALCPIKSEPKYSYSDKFPRHFVRRTIKQSKISAFNQYYESSISDERFKTFSDELNVKGAQCRVIKSSWPCQYENNESILNIMGK